MLKKIVILGPESTGKSTLCSLLAAHYNTLWVPEYAREYLTIHGTAYTYDSLLDIAKGQVALEERYTQQLTLQQPPAATPPALLFIDTDMHVMKVWCEFVYGKCHQWILDQIVARTYDLFLLCDTDLPWAPDPLREYPSEAPRRQLFNMYHDLLVNQSTPWAVIRGNNAERLQAAISAVGRLL